MNVTRRTFLVALGSVPFLQLPAAVPASPVPGWTFQWHDWCQIPNQAASYGCWVAHSVDRGIFNPVTVPDLVLAHAGLSLLQQAKLKGYDEIVAMARDAKPLDPYERYWLNHRV